MGSLGYVGTACTTLETRATVATAPTSGTARWARGSTVGLTATGLALAGHAVAGGGTPPALRLAVLTVVAVLISVGLSGRRWNLGLLLAVLLTAQGAVHVAFGDLTNAAAARASTHLHPGGAVHGMVVDPAGWHIVGAHLLAALLTALLLRRGEAWCWWLVAMVATPLRAVRLLSVSVAPAAATPTVGVERRPMFRQIRLLMLSQARRGPPAAPAV